jgi:flagellar basal body-associated protein FliL
MAQLTQCKQEFWNEIKKILIWIAIIMLVVVALVIGVATYIRKSKESEYLKETKMIEVKASQAAQREAEIESLQQLISSRTGTTAPTAPTAPTVRGPMSAPTAPTVRGPLSATTA